MDDLIKIRIFKAMDKMTKLKGGALEVFNEENILCICKLAEVDRKTYFQYLKEIVNKHTDK